VGEKTLIPPSPMVAVLWQHGQAMIEMMNMMKQKGIG
jgi:hypothetical protein